MTGIKTLLGVGLLALFACSEGGSGASGASLVDRDWELVALGGKTDPVGAGGKPITLRLDSADSRAAGFGGCNRYTGSFELSGAALKFGAVASTRMACDQGMDLEGLYFPALGTVQSWKIVDSLLVLEAAGVPVLRFRAAAKP